MYAIKAMYDGTRFTPMQPIPKGVKGNYEVVITFIEPVKNDVAIEVKPTKRPFSELIGILEGKVWMSDDFDAPLEEMKVVLKAVNIAVVSSLFNGVLQQT